MDPRDDQEQEANKEQSNESAHHNFLEEETTNPEREFPSVGHAQTDFVTRDHGRTSHRMIDHEPGLF